MPFNGHHIWCNGDSRTDPATCKWCIGLKEKYPEDGVTPDELQQRHFPNVVKRGAPTENQGNGEHILQQTNGVAKPKS